MALGPRGDALPASLAVQVPRWCHGAAAGEHHAELADQILDVRCAPRVPGRTRLDSDIHSPRLNDSDRHHRHSASFALSDCTIS